uniref:ubiquitinyl hydrolase 1 n=1 Tax=Capra hircus TaxID=9925 RepID=A0A452ERN2_CAPHI
MTVEQNVLQQSAAQKHQQTFLNQLREITGINDAQILQQALKDSNGNLELAVAFLTAKNAKTPQQEETTYYQTALPGNDRYISVGSQADTRKKQYMPTRTRCATIEQSKYGSKDKRDLDVIDLTGDDKDDLQRAIALSLAESNRAFRETGITDEEQAISRVLEASIAENKECLKRTPTEVWRDSRNPYDRKRQDKAPVGLKNVGNTCWFSAVIQEHRNLPFMRELRYLFALLVGTKRKYVDPSRAVEILKDAFKSNDSQQQDVSEFTHKLLDWLEDAFQMKAEEETDEDKPKNPMVELFYGRFLAVGVLEGKKFENTEMFGQYPLQVNGFKDLHECLEAAMIEGEIESLHSENSGKSGQEHWFTELPPVLTFELSRFEFNQALGRPEKIHNKLEFPQVLYLDRYMHRNREITRIKREEIKRLKDYLTVLQQRLERYLSYGSGPKRFPLVDVLQYALEFASSKPVCTSPVDDIDASSPPSGSVPSQTLPSTTDQQGAPSSELPSTSPASIAAISSRSVIHKPFTQSRIPPDLPMHPAPRHITEEELSVLESCLHRWRTEIENDTRDLQESISRIHRTIDLMYSDKSMIQVPYRLHAVLVHEGQANAGHYWAYIFDHRENRWMKYNDIAVTKSSWEELVRDSFGGYRNASAYCLMYINDKPQFLIQEEFNKETGQALAGIETLPPDLRDFVEEDNQRFEKELEEWDAQLAQKALQEKLLASQKLRESESSVTTAQAGEPEYLEQPSRSDFSKHLKEETIRIITKASHEHEDKSPETVLQSIMMTPNMQGIIMAIGKSRSVYDRCGPEAGFFKAIKLEYSRLVKLAQEDTPPETDYRLHHVIVYFIQNQAPKKIIEKTLLEQFADRNLSFDERCHNIMKVAQAKIEMIKPEEVNMEEYEEWHQDYRKFRETTMYLIIGLENFQRESYIDSLLFLICAYQNNKELLSKGPYRGHDEELISHYRRECLLKLNEQAAELFESGEDREVNNGLIIMNEFIVPFLPLLLVDEMEEKDILAVEDMRNRWCSYLGQEMESNLQEKLTDFLPKLLDCSTEVKGFHEPPKLPPYSTHELCERFTRIMLSLSRTPADGR